MKQLLAIALCTISLCVIAQTRKTPVNKRPNVTVKKTTPKKVTKTDEELAIEKAQEWFKTNYVETAFKDPYSYRVVGIKAVPLTHRESIDKLISKVKKRMDESKLSPEDRTESALADLKKEIRDGEVNMSLLKNKTDVYSRKKYNIYAEYQVKFLELAKRVETYLLDEKEYKSLLSSKAAMSEEQLNTFAYYDIHLDCYSKNELGNEVLGRFVFPFTKDGVVVDDKTTLLMLEKVN